MAKVVITLSDNDDGSVHFNLESEPHMLHDGELTHAQAAALDCVHLILGEPIKPGAN